MRVAALLPDRGFLYEEENVEDERNGGEAAEDEEQTPAEATKEEEVEDGGEHIAGGIALLQQAGEQAAADWRGGLHGQRRADAPGAAHHHAEEGANDEQCRVVGGEAGENSGYGEDAHVDHERNAAAVTISEDAEDEAADGAEEQGHGDDEGDLGRRSCETRVRWRSGKR